MGYVPLTAIQYLYLYITQNSIRSNTSDKAQYATMMNLYQLSETDLN